MTIAIEAYTKSLKDSEERFKTVLAKLLSEVDSNLEKKIRHLNYDVKDFEEETKELKVKQDRDYLAKASQEISTGNLTGYDKLLAFCNGDETKAAKLLETIVTTPRTEEDIRKEAMIDLQSNAIGREYLSVWEDMQLPDTEQNRLKKARQSTEEIESKKYQQMMIIESLKKPWLNDQVF